MSRNHRTGAGGGGIERVSTSPAAAKEALKVGESLEEQYLIRINELQHQVHWPNGINSAKLASQTEIVRVYFDTTLKVANFTPQYNINLHHLSENTQQNQNKTKQSQEFETHLQQCEGGNSIGMPSSAAATTTTTTTTTTINSTENQQQQSTTQNSLAQQQQIATTTELPTGWPQQQQLGQSTTTTTTTTTTTATTTTESSTTTVSATTEGPVGSKTARQGDAIVCGEANANGKSNKRLLSDRIVGGYKSEPGEFPFQVRLNIRSRRGSGICGGVILDRQHILTAAHCMTACVSQQLITATIESTGVKATLGDHSIRANDGEIEFDVDRIIAHEKYDACNFYANDHDIALIKLNQLIDYRFTTDGYGSINRPCIPSCSSNINTTTSAKFNNNNTILYNDGEQVIVSGWGVTRENSGALSNILRYVQVPIVSINKCQETYGSRVTDNHVCAGFRAGGKDSCQGDSGGPLVRVVDNRYELVGIVSFGYGCGQPSAPGVYTRVASYIDWINANI